MPPPIDAGPARVELGQLRELLGVDRSGAGEKRQAASPVRSLDTATYNMPLRVQWRRALRRHKRLRVLVWCGALSVVSAGGLWGAWQLRLLPLRIRPAQPLSLELPEYRPPTAQARQIHVAWEPRQR
jgi:hypothetical protein